MDLSKDVFQLAVEMPDNKRLETELRFAVDYLSANRLSESAKWAAELLSSIKMPEKHYSTTYDQDDDMDVEEAIDPTLFRNDIDSYPIKANTSFDYLFYEKKSKSNDIVNAARVLFDLREYRKAVHKLEKHIKPTNQPAIFIYYYSLFLLSEQQTEEEKIQSTDNVSRSTKINNELIRIENDLKEFYENQELNAINLYMYGTVLKKRNKQQKAKQVLIEAINKYPLLWSAWLELNIMLKKEDQDLIRNNIEDHWAKNFFMSSYFIQIQQENDSVNVNGALKNYFPDSLYLLNEIGHACYLNQNFSVALDIFKKLISLDPNRYESMDLYSNILYIQENYGELAHLAYRCFKNDKYRPETCCVLGNYYSLRGDHEKAVLYFKRAIKLDSSFLSAWTLMGHEFLELKSTSLAIEAYRTAVDIDPTDFRAWYGLGQTYEIHQLYDYASYYFANAALSRPQDARMWSAMGECYQNIKKTRDATKCYERAERFKDTEGIALYKLAKLYVSMNDLDKAASCYEEDLKRKEFESADTSETVEACLFLARYYNSKGNSEMTKQYAERLMETHGPEREEAKQLIAHSLK